jgi:hypothetical protein
VYEAIQAVKVPDSALPEELSWHTALHFQPAAGKGWNTIYEADGEPVIIERAFGPGTLVLCSDSYFVSNEALQIERHADLLAWLIGPQATVVFDETHLGVMENPGIATLIRKYRLTWFVGSLIVLALLFVWKNIVSFVPPVADAASIAEERAGKDSVGGLINLLRQNIPARKLPSMCIEEWAKSVSHRKKDVSSKLEAVRREVAADAAAAPRERQEPVAMYRMICRVLNEQK